MAFIMDQVNGPQYTVWANRKFVGRNKEEVTEYILYDRESINEEAHELSNNQAECDKPEVRLFSVSNSIFEELEPSSGSVAIEGIAEVDPMGACLLTLLSKHRPLTCRDSITITQIED
jgi:hypothetical protein